MLKKVADQWYAFSTIDDAITLITEPHVTPWLRCNIWHIRGRDQDVVVDTGMGICSLREAARHLFGHRISAVASHVHLDHVGCHHEFDECLVHRAEADALRTSDGHFTLVEPGFDPHDFSLATLGGHKLGPIITALPSPDYDLDHWKIQAAHVTRTLDEGDVIDLGNRHFEVLHLPGHSPGSIGLWEAKTQTLFSGDAIYDGELLDNLAHSSIEAYIRTMHRLRELPVRVVHGGHCASFGRERLIELVDGYLKKFDP
ncbi:MBL fold metallo-hydrolase [Pseudomonas sp. GD03842]|uniref:MBL fold metallo-hydrolase n=1 Tax=Pseudomonas sp. GD03842 TaxID=2975385 RepID=UPI002446ECCF|nr:MBL fold metallo-hydrolase [Pseudomonas sp. GD03842]MDH0744924.1 MBL fold metallo-hydrolase [Pseudomonas sp. GD03842]